ncbi:MAG TPA: trehalose-phosphatase [Acidimicrobiales bacterium]|nr:trehalose-phosphatase [Acidimicrobiales bacterium]
MLVDFDGTLSPIVDDPAEARPLPATLDALDRLPARYRRVAVVSGRPAGFLVEHLGLGRGAASHGPSLVVSALYGLEWAGSGGVVHTRPEAEPWREVVDQVERAARAAAPPGMLVEHKGLTVTFHWRTATANAGWAQAFAEEMSRETGLELHPAKMSIELRPPVPADKGTVVTELCRGLGAACFVGDDRGDLAAFAALDRLAAEGMITCKVAVAGAEIPPEVRAAADVVVDGPEGVAALLEWLGAS